MAGDCNISSAATCIGQACPSIATQKLVNASPVDRKCFKTRRQNKFFKAYFVFAALKFVDIKILGETRDNPIEQHKPLGSIETFFQTCLYCSSYGCHSRVCGKHIL